MRLTRKSSAGVQVVRRTFTERAFLSVARMTRGKTFAQGCTGPSRTRALCIVYIVVRAKWRNTHHRLVLTINQGFEAHTRQAPRYSNALYELNLPSPSLISWSSQTFPRALRKSGETVGKRKHDRSTTGWTHAEFASRRAGFRYVALPQCSNSPSQLLTLIVKIGNTLMDRSNCHGASTSGLAPEKKEADVS